MIDNDNIRLVLLVDDPSLGEDGKQLHKQHELSQYLLDESSVTERDTLEMAIRKMADAVADEWESQRYQDTTD